jgi:hypothetical protein
MKLETVDSEDNDIVGYRYTYIYLTTLSEHFVEQKIIINDVQHVA